MKKLILIVALFTFCGLSAQTVSSLDFEESNDDAATQIKSTELDKKTAGELTPLSGKKLSQFQQKALNNRLLKKADQYFDKMWYSEAAQLYDMALKDDVRNLSMNLLQRAGDAHYFNSNMEKAYYWYDKMYDLYKKEISDANFFKYTHTLKGTGRFNRARRLLRLFNKSKDEIEAQGSQEELINRNAEIVGKNYEIKNLDVNTPYSDFSPMFHNENQLVFASSKDSSYLNTRRFKWNNQPFLDLYVGEVGSSEEKLNKVQKLSKNINTKYHEAAVTFSPDNNTMYFTRNNYGKKLKRDKNGINHLKLYMSKKINNEWTEAIELPFNSENYSTGHPAMSPDGKKLFFVSDKPGGFGDTDIYVVDVLENGKFSKPRNLGRGINTAQREMFPFVTNDMLYFSSDRAFGLGGLDIYKAQFIDNTFEVAVNVGQPINSNRDDFSYVINEETQKGYFASNRSGGKGDDDIYSFKKLIVDNKDDRSVIVGVVTEYITGDVMPNALVALVDENNNKLKEAKTREDGSFVFEDVANNTTYTITTNNKEYLQSIQTVNLEGEKQIDIDVVLKRLDDMIVEVDGVKKLKNDIIHFDFDKDKIRDDASEELDKLVEVWSRYPSMIIKIESHTDARGPKSYNKYLSQKRADSTKEYLLSKGIDESRIESAIGYGEDRPVNDCVDGVNCGKDKHEENRRAEFIIVKL
jgi:outer membrane protein OmpA-like peptidoglycan-associated protein